MKAIMQSINPEHVFNMRVSGKRFPLKRIEVRKSAPKETPFKAYIYETKQKEKSFVSTTIDGVKTEVIIRRSGCGKVVGEYICRKVEIVYADNMIEAYYNNCPETRLTDEQLYMYADGKPLKFLYMEDVIFYDKPKELSEFRKPCEYAKFEYKCFPENCDRCPWNTVIRAPQSHFTFCFNKTRWTAPTFAGKRIACTPIGVGIVNDTAATRPSSS